MSAPLPPGGGLASSANRCKSLWEAANKKPDDTLTFAEFETLYGVWSKQVEELHAGRRGAGGGDPQRAKIVRGGIILALVLLLANQGLFVFSMLELSACKDKLKLAV